MEKGIRQKVAEHFEMFKDNILNWIQNNEACIMVHNCNKTNDFLQYMSDFPHIELSKEDFQKRKE